MAKHAAAAPPAEEKSLETRGTTALAEVPEWLRESKDDTAGKENVTKDDLMIPRLCVANALSPERKKGNEKYIQGLEDGQLFNSVTKEIYGDKVEVVPLFFFRHFIHFKPLDEGGGIVAQYNKAEDVPRQDLEWHGTDKPVVTEFKNRMCAVRAKDGSWMPIVVSFKSTGLKFARQWNSLINLNKKASYSMSYTMVSVHQTKGSQDWYGIAPQGGGKWVSKDVYENAKVLYDNLQAGGYQVDTEGIEREDRNTNEGAGDGNSPF